MDALIKYYLINTIKSPLGATNEMIQRVLNQLDFQLPLDYIELMSFCNGCDGAIGAGGWLTIFPLNEIIQINKDYHWLMNEIPDYFLIGKDAADTGYAYHKKQLSIWEFGLMSNFKTDPIDFCGNNILDFFAYLYKPQS